MKKEIITEYYEAKIQLRNFNQEILNFLTKELQKNKVLIVKETKLKEGVDLYITSAKICYPLSRKFKERFKGETKLTRSLVGLNKNKGKRIHRITLLLRNIEK